MYVLRFIQSYRPADRQVFLDIEAGFQKLELLLQEFPRVRRSQPIAGKDSLSTLIWECELPAFDDVQKTITLLANDPRHTELFKQQSPYITEMRTEIFEVLEF